MKKALGIIILVLVFLGAFMFKPAEASLLRLYADPSIYIGADPDPWFEDGYLTGPGADFKLQLLNDYKIDDDPYLNVIKNLYLVIAMKESTKTGLTIELNGDTLDGSDFVNTGTHPFVEKHGVFGEGTYYYDYLIGDLLPEQAYELNMSIETDGSPIVHFDAYGDLVFKKGKKGYETMPINNPYSKDVTWDPPRYNEGNPPVIPEPGTLSLLGLGLLGLFGIKRKK